MTVSASDNWIPTENGRLFARVWTPADSPVTGETIVLFHDSLGCVELWRDFPDQLARATGRRVVAYDRLGFGRSDPHPGLLSPSFISLEAATTVPLVLDSLGLGTIVPFGHSVGGGMAIATAARWPERCAAVITESAQSFIEDRTLAGIRAARAEFAQPGQMERLARYHGAKAPWVLNAWVETWLGPDFAHWNLDDDLRRLRRPALTIHGDRDEFGSLEQPERIVRETDGLARAVILDDCGHVPHREHASRVLDEVARFLDE